MKRAFTLIELLVVIAIIAIIAGILFPVFSSAKYAAKGTACMSNMKQLGTAVTIYLSDSDGGYPTAYGNRTPTAAWVLSGHGAVTGTTSPACTNATETYDLCSVADPTKGSLYAYAKSAEIYKCPAVQTGTHTATGASVTSATQRVTYSMNYLYGGTVVDLPTGGRGSAGINESIVSYPSGTIFLVDEDVTTRNDGLFVWTSNPSTDEVGDMHRGGANLLHADTSTRRYPANAVRLNGGQRYKFRVEREEP